MKSGLEGRNNLQAIDAWLASNQGVSMKSGLEGRNNRREEVADDDGFVVSMKSGLEGRNNPA